MEARGRKPNFLIFLHLLIYFFGACVQGTLILRHVCGSQRTACGGWFYPRLVQILATEYPGCQVWIQHKMPLPTEPSHQSPNQSIPKRTYLVF